VKHILATLTFILVMLPTALETSCLASPSAGMMPVNDIIELEQKKPAKIQLSAPISSLSSPLKGRVLNSEAMSSEDLQNLSGLWTTVINRNPVIQYGLKELATPPELRYAHSSIMSRTLSGLLSGAALIPYTMGADQFTAGATTLSANLVDRAMQQSKKIDPTTLPSDTELVELSGFVQSLQKTLVESYYQYKNSLQATAQLSQSLEKIKTQYQQAKAANNTQDSLWLNQLYKQTEYQHQLSWQSAKRHYLILERLVGTKGLQAVRFGDARPETGLAPKAQDMASEHALLETDEKTK
jgi:hypothetical protein